MEQSETLYSNPAILEAATRALDNCIEGYQAIAIVAAVTPLIRAQVLEEVTKAMDRDDWSTWEEVVAAVTRALKEQP